MYSNNTFLKYCGNQVNTSFSEQTIALREERGGRGGEGGEGRRGEERGGEGRGREERGVR